jgi:hypothetical protein
VSRAARSARATFVPRITGHLPGKIAAGTQPALPFLPRRFAFLRFGAWVRLLQPVPGWVLHPLGEPLDRHPQRPGQPEAGGQVGEARSRCSGRVGRDPLPRALIVVDQERPVG